MKKNKMRVNEIFYSLQGEGRHSGRAAVFVRFSGCNLKCAFCDTLHQQYKEMTEDDIVKEVLKYPCLFVVFTGGEPAMQLTESIVEKLHAQARYVAVETNGTIPLPKNVDWITLSPKNEYVGEKGVPVVTSADEIKVIFKNEPVSDITRYGLTAEYYYLQPCDTGDAEKNKEITAQCIEYIKKHPIWRLSLQTQKIVQIR